MSLNNLKRLTWYKIPTNQPTNQLNDTCRLKDQWLENKTFRLRDIFRALRIISFESVHSSSCDRREQVTEIGLRVGFLVCGVEWFETVDANDFSAQTLSLSSR